jgi:predicted metal-dependent HD superfamily phosphohydrolase
VDAAAFLAALPANTDPAAAATVARDLLARWSEPHRQYHTVNHLATMLSIVDANARLAADLQAVRLAAWFHDAVYDPTAAPGANEAASAALAIQYLAMLDVDEARADEVARLVRLTAGHDPTANDRNGCLLADADLAILASDEPVYDAYATAVRREYHHLPAPLYRAGRIRVLDHLLALPQLYRIVPAWSEWTGSAHGNLRRERARLLSAPPD